MRHTFNRLKYIAASVLFVLTTALSTGGAVFADSLSNNSNNPPGNNGTVKIDGTDIDQLRDNDPHVSCSFSVQWFGFDLGSRTSTVNFTAQEPTGTASLLTDQVTFTGSGAGNTLDKTANYDLTSALSSYTPQPQQGYHVKLVVSTDGSQGNDTKSKVFWVGPCGSETQYVTPAAPSATEPTCTVTDMIVTPSSQEGVVWSPVSTTTLQMGQSVTYQASPAQGYAFPEGTQVSWDFTNNFDDSNCGCGCENTVTPAAVQFNDVCGLENDTYTIPSTPHVNYYVNGSNTPTAAGTYHISAAGVVTVEAVATDDYTISGDHTWSYDFTNADCLTRVTPPPVTFKDLCERENDTFTIPSQTGVVYKVNGEPIDAGTYDAYLYDVDGTVTVTAEAMEGYQLVGDQATWSHTFTNEECGGNGGQTPVTPAAVTFTEPTCTVAGMFTVPTTAGVVYKDKDGNTLTAGNYTAAAGATVTVTAVPANDGVTLTGTTSWSHTFTTPTNCGSGSGGFVLGASTVATAPMVVGRGAELANTGTNTMATTIVAVFVLLSSLVLYGYRPKVEA